MTRCMVEKHLMTIRSTLKEQMLRGAIKFSQRHMPI